MQKTAIVTGAGKGLGLEFTKQLLASEYKVIATARKVENYPALVTDSESNNNLDLMNLDVSSEESIKAFADSLKNKTEHIDLLVNCAGINSKSNHPHSQASSLKLGELEQQSLLNQFAVNTVGPILLAQSSLPMLKASRQARVLNVSSWLGPVSIKTSGGNYGYCTSKSALNMMNVALANDLKEDGVICVNFNPGWVRSDMGGDKAKLSAEESVEGMLKTLEGLGAEATGRFLQWDGTEHPW